MLSNQYLRHIENKKRAETLEEFIEKSPQWHGGTTYRGMTLSDSELKDVMNSLRNGTFDNRGTASWSTSESIADGFADDKHGSLSETYQGETKTNRVVLKLSEQKHATSIKHLSHYSHEQEVVASKRCRYRLVKRQERVIDGKKYIYLEVEAI